MRFVCILACLALFACDDDSDSSGAGGGVDPGAGGAGGGAGGEGGGVGGEGGGEPIEAPETYTFNSRFTDGSSVSYSGQTKRHVLVEEMKGFLGSLTDQTFDNPQPGDVKAAILYYFDFASVGGPDYALTLSSHLPLAQPTMGDLGGLATLREKMPDQDAGWAGGVVGYGDGTMSPTVVFEDMAQKVEDQVLARFAGEIPMDPTGAAIDVPFVSPEGVDYQQLIQKYLTGAIFLSQAADDYLDDDLEGKGLLSDNTMASVKDGDSLPYSALEHVWDEGFGYFGAARDYDAYTDDEIAVKGGRDGWQGAHDTDGDGMIDLGSEYVFGAAQNAAKRDRGSMSGTDFTQDAFDAFIRGRTIIVNANGALDEAEMEALKGERDAALKAWEAAIAATVVHYINDVLRDMGTFGTEAYNFRDHAKHWSEMKGFALVLQFDPNHGPWAPENYARLHAVLGDAPVLPNADEATIQGYMGGLQEAKAILAETYEFDMADMGDADGMNGW